MLMEDFTFLVSGEDPSEDEKLADALLYKKKYSGGNYIAFWNFQESMTDKVGGVVATLSGATRDGEGLHFTGNTNRCKIPKGLFKKGYTYEIAFGICSSSISFGNNGFLLSYPQYETWSPAQGFGWTASSKFGMWSDASGWRYIDGLTDPNYWSGKILKIKIEDDGKWSIYEGKTLLYTSPVAMGYSDVEFYLGSYGDGRAYYNMVIKSLKIY